ncbi:MAG: TIR domain-containing protein [Clostridia bacterium]|nr:TIR domain-containing protein [Clostridia bacterium]
MELYCKACGTELEVEEGQKVITCDFCGMEQTLPQIDSPEKVELFMDANEDRLACKFDIAKGKYESLIEQYPDDNEAYWCKLLCIYGIEYVDDTLTEKKLPTCHRTLRESIFDNSDYKLIMSRATLEERAIYEAEAKEIDRIQKEILEIADKSEPYDIFICYKETDEDGRRTRDSQIATKIYTNLTNKGYKVFFSRVTLKGMAGSKYEPVIYSALISAKVMLLVSNSASHVDARWVRNEWSRYIEFMREDPDKVIVPCIANMDAYDLPKELSEFQALNTMDMDFTENLTRQIDSKFGRVNYASYGAPYAHSAPQYQQAPSYSPESQEPKDANHATIQNYLNRAKIFLGDNDWERANEYAEKILDIDAEVAEAYLVKVLCSYKQSEIENLANEFDVINNNNFLKAKKFANGNFKYKIEDLELQVKYSIAMKALETDITEKLNYDHARNCLKEIAGYKDASFLYDELPVKREELLKKKNYDYAQALLSKNLADDKTYDSLINYLKKADDYKDARFLLTDVPLKRQQLIDAKNYSDAVAAMSKDLTDDTTYDFVMTHLRASNGYEDANYLINTLPEKRQAQVNEKTYKLALVSYNGDLTSTSVYSKAQELLSQIEGYKDASKLLASLPEKRQMLETEKKYIAAVTASKADLTVSANYDKAQKLLKALKGYKDADSILSGLASKKRDQEKQNAYNSAKTALRQTMTESNYRNTVALLEKASGYRDANQLLANLQRERRTVQGKTKAAKMCSVFGLIATLITFICTFMVGSEQSHIFYFFSNAWDNIGSNGSEFASIFANISGILFTLALLFFNFLFGIKSIVSNIKSLKNGSTYGSRSTIRSVVMYAIFAMLFTSVTMTDATSTGGMIVTNRMNGATVFGITASLILLFAALVCRIASGQNRCRFRDNKGFYITGIIRLILIIVIYILLPWSITFNSGSESISYTAFSMSYCPMIAFDQGIEVAAIFDSIIFFPLTMITMMMFFNAFKSLYEPSYEYSRKHNITFLVFSFLRMIFLIPTTADFSYTNISFAPIVITFFLAIAALVFTLINLKLQEDC